MLTPFAAIGQLLDQWSEDLQQYELVLDSLASTSLDGNVKEEIKHVDQWYRHLSEAERTATMYALLQHSTPLQIRFFVTVLQQLGKQDPVSSLLSPVYAEYGKVETQNVLILIVFFLLLPRYREEGDSHANSISLSRKHEQQQDTIGKV